MPTYEYQCEECGKVFEMDRPVAERDAEAPCPECGSTKTKRLLSRGIILVGLESNKEKSSACATCSLDSCSTCSLASRK